jgi:hypothetical protein
MANGAHDATTHDHTSLSSVAARMDAIVEKCMLRNAADILITSATCCYHAPLVVWVLCQ